MDFCAYWLELQVSQEHTEFSGAGAYRNHRDVCRDRDNHDRGIRLGTSRNSHKHRGRDRGKHRRDRVTRTCAETVATKTGTRVVIVRTDTGIHSHGECEPPWPTPTAKLASEHDKQA